MGTYKDIIKKYNVNFINTVKIFGGIVVLCLVVYFSARNLILNYAINKVSDKLKQKYSLNLLIQSSKFTGVSTLNIAGLKLFQSNKDTLLSCNKVEVDLKLFQLLLGSVRVNNFYADSTKIILNKSKQGDNFSFLLKSKNTKKTKDNEERSALNFGELANKILDQVFDIIPKKISANSVSIVFKKDSKYSNWSIPIISLEDGKISAHVIIDELMCNSAWNVSGKIVSADRTADLKIYPTDLEKRNIPIINSLFNIKTGFDTLLLSLDNNDYSNGILEFNGKALVKNFFVNHWRISTKDVEINNGEIDFSFYIDDNSVTLDSSTVCILNQIKIYPFVKILTKPAKEYQLKIAMPTTKSDEFFSSLPKGLFQSFENFKSNGQLSYNLNFVLNEAKPDSLVFNSNFNSKNLKITSYGNSELNKLNSEFIYTAYEKGYAVRSFLVGESNPYFYTINEISPYLRNAILCSEDGDFYWHKGFNERAFRKSIATNFKEKKFKRGGSTISMQLVKNVFLTRNKTVARKLEEALIVWLIENNRIVSKDRMYEVYLNIIEWGPNVYGIGEAAEYYFKKTPSELNIQESIFLAMIIPRPKWFYYNFDETGKIKSHTADFFKIISKLLVKREIISEEENQNLNPEIVLIGEAKQKLKIKADSLLIEPDKMLFDYGGE
ncbi:MAG: transglycosylase domain-containing protein [Bacteroidota bacterium]